MATGSSIPIRVIEAGSPFARSPTAAMPASGTVRPSGSANPPTPTTFKGSANSERVRQWRARHPGYWRRSGNPNLPSAKAPCNAMQPENPVHQPLKPEPGPITLQDLSLPYPPVLVGLVALHLGSALQEDIRPQLDLLARNGLAILRHGAGGWPSVP